MWMARSVEPVAVARLDCLFDVRVAFADQGVSDQGFRRSWHIGGVGPRIRVPETGADHAFRAVRQHAQNVDDENVVGSLRLTASAARRSASRTMIAVR